MATDDFYRNALTDSGTCFVFPAAAGANDGPSAGIRRNGAMDGWEFTAAYGDGTGAEWEPVPDPVADCGVEEIMRAVQAVVWDRTRNGTAP